MAYGTVKADVLQSDTAGTPPQFNDGNGVQTGTLCRAWVSFTGSTGVVIAGFNVSSITRNAAGDYTFNFTTAITDANYAIVGMGTAGGANYQIPGSNIAGGTVKTTTSLRTPFGYVSSIGGALFAQDPATGYIAIFR